MLLMIPKLRLENDVYRDSKEASKDLNQQRRLSIVSALRLSLEKSAVIEPQVTHKESRQSNDQDRGLLFELLSKV